MDKDAVLRELEEIKKSGDKNRFWRIVGVVKREDVIDEDVVDEIARVRDAIFDVNVVVGYRLGAAIFFLLFIASYTFLLYLVYVELNWLIKLVLAVLLESLVLYFSFLTGRCLGSLITGIKFVGFYRYNPLELGLKLDYRSYLRAGKVRRVLLFATPILFEHVVLLSQVLILLALSSYLFLLPLLLLAVNLPFSYLVHKKLRTGELHRFLRELRILRSES